MSGELNTEMPVSPSINRLVKVFIKMRDRKAELMAEIKSITTEQEILEQELLAQAIASGVTGFKTDAGTTYISEQVNFSMADDKTFIDFVRSTGNIDLLERRVSVHNIEAYMADHEDQIPPGLNWFKQDRMKVRRSSK